MVLLDYVEISQELFQFLATSELLYEGVCELSEGKDGIFGQVGIPL